MTGELTKRKYFGTDGIRGRVGSSYITPEFILKLGWAAGRVLGNTGNNKALIGKDTRISGYMLESALESGLSASGVDVLLVGPMPSPGIAYLTRTFRASMGIVISASHNSYLDNGIKIFSADGSKLPDEIEQAIEVELEKPLITVESAKLGKASRIEDARGRYIEFCKSLASCQLNLKGLKIVVDCSNGATYNIAPHIFSELGAEVIELGVDPNGLNINQHYGPDYPAILQKIVLAEEADLGIALDGDGDRLTMVDHKGEVLDGDEILFIIAKHRTKNGLFSGGLVGTVMSNLGFELAVQALGLPFARSQVGDRYVIEELKKRNWQLGGETSGHIICLKSTTTGDGIVAGLHVLGALFEQGGTLHDLKKGMSKFPQIIVNVQTTRSKNLLHNPTIKKAVKHAAAQLAKCGRVVLRPSGTEPILRIMVEGDNKSQVDKMALELADIVKATDLAICS